MKKQRLFSTFLTLVLLTLCICVPAGASDMQGRDAFFYDIHGERGGLSFMIFDQNGQQIPLARTAIATRSVSLPNGATAVVGKDGNFTVPFPLTAGQNISVNVNLAGTGRLAIGYREVGSGDSFTYQGTTDQSNHSANISIPHDGSYFFVIKNLGYTPVTITSIYVN